MSGNDFLQVLHGWQSFYTLLGGAAATLTGLMFVAASLGTRFINDAADPKVRTFVTPPVIYFSLVLLLSVLMNVPNQTPAALTFQLLAVGLIGCGYSLSHLRRLRRFHLAGEVGGRDWAWSLMLPLSAALCLSGSACAVREALEKSLDAAAAGAVLLIFVGIHNAWDVTLYLVRRTPS